MIVCWRTVAIPDAERARFLAWISENRAVRDAHGICAELVFESTNEDDEAVVLTIWPSHEVFDAWIATPERSPTPMSIAPSNTGRSPVTTSSAAT
jgi:heme-degrading monooxygenase HmoA